MNSPALHAVFLLLGSIGLSVILATLNNFLDRQIKELPVIKHSNPFYRPSYELSPASLSFGTIAAALFLGYLKIENAGVILFFAFVVGSSWAVALAWCFQRSILPDSPSQRSAKYVVISGIRGAFGASITCACIALIIAMTISNVKGAAGEVSHMPESTFAHYAGTDGILTYKKVHAVLDEQMQLQEQETALANAQSQLTADGGLSKLGPETSTAAADLKKLEDKLKAQEIPSQDLHWLWLLSNHSGMFSEAHVGSSTGYSFQQIQDAPALLYAQYHRWYWLANGLQKVVFS